MEQSGAVYMAHKIDHGYSYAEGAYYALEHYEKSFFASVEISDKTEKHSGQYTVYGVGIKVIVG